jgi:deoxyribodipyrimidine photolyase
MPSVRISTRTHAASGDPTIVWFRQDLRLTDHPALHAACKAGGVIPVYILDTAGEAEWAPGGAAKWWLHHSLVDLDMALRAKGSRLIRRQGDSLEVLRGLIRETGARALLGERLEDTLTGYAEGPDFPDREGTSRLSPHLRFGEIGIREVWADLNLRLASVEGDAAAPYFRIIHPVTQGERFDPQGEYVRRWVPELAGLDSKWIHRPWEAPAEALAKAGIVPGRTYPKPLVDHAAARARALAAYHSLRDLSRPGGGFV